MWKPLVRSRQIWRVGHDQVETPSGYGLEQVPAHRLHLHAIELRVDPGGEHCKPRDIDGAHLPPVQRGDYGEDAASRAQIEHTAALRKRLPGKLIREHPAIAMRFKHARQRDEAHAKGSIPAERLSKLAGT
jgi:hypothetical protein